MTQSYDVIIVGGGPAGCAAANYLSKRNVRTLLISKKVAPSVRRSLAVESLGQEFITNLIELGLQNVLQGTIIGWYESIEQFTKACPQGYVRQGAQNCGIHLDKAKFNANMEEAAKFGGVHFIRDSVNGFQMTRDWVHGVKTVSGKEYNSAYVIDATGASHLSANAFKITVINYSPHLVVWTGGANLNSGIAIKNQYNSQFSFEDNGWSWIAWQSPQQCWWTRLAINGRHDLRPPDCLRGLSLNSAIHVYHSRWRIFKELASPGMIRCGDAAGLLDPAAGQGIKTAILSGMEASKTVMAILADPDCEKTMLRKYERWYVRHYLEKIRLLAVAYEQSGIVFQ
ncbi:MAG TPA: tryptophan 7-halogenase [Flavisolibacter sp.]|nr:tryptophan 7-halogenase [Flavisolibacter sp.]